MDYIHNLQLSFFCAAQASMQVDDQMSEEDLPPKQNPYLAGGPDPDDEAGVVEGDTLDPAALEAKVCRVVARVMGSTMKRP